MKFAVVGDEGIESEYCDDVIAAIENWEKITGYNWDDYSSDLWVQIFSDEEIKKIAAQPEV